MKSAKSTFAALALGMLICTQPILGWASHVIGGVLSGEITGLPVSGQIEVDHVIYRVQPGSAAAQVIGNFHIGSKIDLVLDGPAASKASSVVAISPHTGY